MKIFTQYRNRIVSIITFRSRKWYYCIIKALCALIGLPLYVVLLPVDFLLACVYALFSGVPFLRELFFVVCKCLGYIVAVGYYIGVVPDARHYIAEAKAQAALERAQRAAENGEAVAIAPAAENAASESTAADATESENERF